MGKYYGERVSAAQTSTDRRYLPPGEKRTRPGFLYMVHPHRWAWDREINEWLPEFGRMVISGGVQGVAITPSGREDASAARAHYTSRGWIILENGDARFADVLPPDEDGIRRGHYISKWAARPRGWAYAAVWESPDDVGGNVQWEVDRDLERAFKLAIRDRIMGGGPSRKLRERFVAEQEKICRRAKTKAADRGDKWPQIRTRLQNEVALLEAYKTELARDEPADPTVPAKRRGRPPKSETPATEVAS